MTSNIKKPWSTSTNDMQIRVLGGHHAPLSLYRQLESQLQSRIQTIEEGKLYTLKEIAGEAFWSTLTNNWVKRVAGRCFAHMVAVGTFPFEFVQYKRYCTKRYQLK